MRLAGVLVLCRQEENEKMGAWLAGDRRKGKMDTVSWCAAGFYKMELGFFLIIGNYTFSP
jgi:hypothetical protein